MHVQVATTDPRTKHIGVSNDTTSVTMMDDPDADERTDPRASVEAYRDDDGVVLHDAQNPLAWVQSTAAVAVEEYR